MTVAIETRPLSEKERRLARWMLEHGTPEAARFMGQLDRAEATLWRCACGCASFNFKVDGEPEAPPGVKILGDYMVGDGDAMFGIFIFQREGFLSGVEVYGLAADPPPILPEPEELRQADFRALEAMPSLGDNA